MHGDDTLWFTRAEKSEYKYSEELKKWRNYLKCYATLCKNVKYEAVIIEKSA